MDKQKTGVLIREARIAKNYTQSELGNLIGVSNKAVSRWENGESFPDIGVLEMLAQTLDMPVQDIVMGEKSKEDDRAVVEVVRIAKMQALEKRGKILKNIVGVAAIIYICILSMLGLSSYGAANLNWSIVYGVSYFVIISLVIWNAYHEKKTLGIGSNKKAIIMILVPAITYICEIAVLSISFLLISKGIMPFNLEPYVIGPTLNTFLCVVMLVNLLVSIYVYYEMVRKDNKVSVGVCISVAAILLSGLNGELLHNLITFEEVWKCLLTNIFTITIEMVIAIIIGIRLTRKNK